MPKPKVIAIVGPTASGKTSLSIKLAHGEVFIGFGDVTGEGPATFNLSESGDLTEAAANLFAHLRAADRMAASHGLNAIAVAPIPMKGFREGLGEAINDRLTRAAAPKDHPRN